MGEVGGKKQEAAMSVIAEPKLVIFGTLAHFFSINDCPSILFLQMIRLHLYARILTTPSPEPKVYCRFGIHTNQCRLVGVKWMIVYSKVATILRI